MAILTVPIQIDVEHAKQIYQQGAKDFAEWAEDKGYFDNYYAPFLSEMLSEWQKGAENESSD